MTGDSGVTTATPELPERFEYVECLESRRLRRMRDLGLITDDQLWGERDPRETLQAFGIPSPHYCRRPGWTMGAAVRLADGRRWHLPRLTPALAITTPGLMATVRAFLRVLDVHQADVEDMQARWNVHQEANRLAQVLIGANYQLGGVYGPDLIRLAPDEREQRHRDTLARVTNWGDVQLWTTCCRALVSALDAAPKFLDLCVAFDLMLGWADSPN